MKLTKGLKLGPAMELWKCPREIRISFPRLGEIVEGFNTGVGEKQRYICIKTSKDINKCIMQLIKE